MGQPLGQAFSFYHPKKWVLLLTQILHMRQLRCREAVKHAASQMEFQFKSCRHLPPTLPTFCSPRPLCGNSHAGGAPDSPQEKLLTWWHGCCYSPITEATERKLDTISINKQQHNNVHSTITRASPKSCQV